MTYLFTAIGHTPQGEGISLADVDRSDTKKFAEAAFNFLTRQHWEGTIPLRVIDEIYLVASEILKEHIPG